MTNWDSRLEANVSAIEAIVSRALRDFEASGDGNQLVLEWRKAERHRLNIHKTVQEVLAATPDVVDTVQEHELIQGQVDRVSAIQWRAVEALRPLVEKMQEVAAIVEAAEGKEGPGA